MVSSSQKLKSLYRLQDRLQVKVIEQVDARAWIVSLNGVLIQVYNSTDAEMEEGQILWMQLVSLDPPRLEFI